MGRSIHPLASARLVTAEIPAGSVWHHIFLDKYPDPLGYGYTRSRFSDPRKNPKHRFGVYYVGATFEAAFLETIVRDAKNQNPGLLVIAAAELEPYVHVEVTVHEPLTVVDLSAGKAIVMGIPTDAIWARSQQLGQRTSLAIHEHTDKPVRARSWLESWIGIGLRWRDQPVRRHPIKNDGSGCRRFHTSCATLQPHRMLSGYLPLLRRPIWM